MTEGRKAIEEGKHAGSIVKTDIRKGGEAPNEYQYLDLHVTVDGTNKEGQDPITITAGYPLPMSSGGMTCLMFERFGILPAVGENADESSLVGVRVTFLTQDKKGKKEGQVFSEIIRSTLKPE